MSRSALTQLQLHFSPAPRNITESRAILRVLQRFGEIDMFKVLRFEETTKALTPRAHIIFKYPNSASSLLAAGAVEVPSTNITVVPSESIFRHEQYIEYASASHLVRDESIFGRRSISRLPVKNDLEVEDSSIRFGSNSHMAPSTQAREMRSRLARRYTGDFFGFKDLEERMRIEKEQDRLAEEAKVEEAHEKRRQENVQLARGEDVDISGRSVGSLQEDQLSTIQDILVDLDREEAEPKTKQEKSRSQQMNCN